MNINDIKTKKVLLNLIENWFNNIKNGEINNEILLFIGTNKFELISLEHELITISQLHQYNNFYIILDLKELPTLKNNYKQNIILYTHRNINWETIKNTNRSLLLIETLERDKSVDIAVWFENIIKNCDNYNLLLESDEYYDSLFYIKKRDPIYVIQQDVEKIRNLLSFLLNKKNFQLVNCKNLFFRGYYFDLNKDLTYLDKTNILTSRLAIIIFKISTLTDASDKAIGNYYANELGITSSKKTNKIYEIDSKCYNLNKIFKKDK